MVLIHEACDVVVDVVVLDLVVVAVDKDVSAAIVGSTLALDLVMLYLMLLLVSWVDSFHPRSCTGCLRLLMMLLVLLKMLSLMLAVLLLFLLFVRMLLLALLLCALVLRLMMMMM
jgi:hypothetical protein